MQHVLQSAIGKYKAMHIITLLIRIRLVGVCLQLKGFYAPHPLLGYFHDLAKSRIKK